MTTYPDNSPRHYTSADNLTPERKDRIGSSDYPPNSALNFDDPTDEENASRGYVEGTALKK